MSPLNNDDDVVMMTEITQEPWMLCGANSKFSSKSPGGLEKSVLQRNLQKPKEIEDLISATLKFGAFLVVVVFLDFNVIQIIMKQTQIWI